MTATDSSPPAPSADDLTAANVTWDLETLLDGVGAPDDLLDEAEELDDGNPAELGSQYKALYARLPGLAVVGGCCGTDHRHIEEICKALAA